jgi:hypothetical protein
MGKVSSDEWVEITTEEAVHPYDTHQTTFPEIPIDLPDEPEEAVWSHFDNATAPEAWRYKLLNPDEQVSHHPQVHRYRQSQFT